MEAAKSARELREFKERFNLDAVLSDAVVAALKSGCTNPFEHIAASLREHSRSSAPGPTATSAPQQCSNEENLSRAALGILRHKPPEFRYFDPQEIEDKSLLIKEVKLPLANETHELCYEPVSNCVFATQMSNSVLVRIPVGADGLLLDDHDAWGVGEVDPATGKGIVGLHNVSISASHPGCLWLSLQFANTLVLLDGRTMSVLSVIRVPTFYKKKGTAEVVRVGGPHCVRECPKTGNVWVALKGAVSCHPAPIKPEEEAEMSAPRLDRLRRSMRRACCSPGALGKYMEALNEREEYECPPPDGFAIWRFKLSEYDPTAQDNGGTLHPCPPSPPMVTLDREGNCWAACDQSPCILRIDATTGESEEIPAPSASFDPHHTLTMTGPAIGVAPDGAVWFSMLGLHGAICRVDPKTNEMTLHQIGGPQWCRVLRIIHFEFDSIANGSDDNQLYLLSSDLLDENSVNGIVMLRFDETWTKIVGRRVLPLPTQDCSCHRICIVAPPYLGRRDKSVDVKKRSVVVSEMTSSKVLQVLVENLDVVQGLDAKEPIAMGECKFGGSRIAYLDRADVNGQHC